MTNRREFLQIGITAGAFPLAASAARVAGTDMITRAPLELHAVIYDERFSNSVEFAAEARRLGLPTRAISGDMTRLWYDDLYHVWQRRPAAIAGLTAHGALFCFDQLARDRGMRVVFESEHRPLDNRTIRHAITGPSSMLSACAKLGDVDRAWSGRMAEIIAHCPRGRSEMADASVTSAHDGSVLPNGTDALFSWVIAPAVKV
jgi:hypothetical protein